MSYREEMGTQATALVSAIGDQGGLLFTGGRFNFDQFIGRVEEDKFTVITFERREMGYDREFDVVDTKDAISCTQERLLDNYNFQFVPELDLEDY